MWLEVIWLCGGGRLFVDEGVGVEVFDWDCGVDDFVGEIEVLYGFDVFGIEGV